MRRSAASEISKSGGHLQAFGRNTFISAHAFKRRTRRPPVSRHSKTASGPQRVRWNLPNVQHAPPAQSLHVKGTHHYEQRLNLFLFSPFKAILIIGIYYSAKLRMTESEFLRDLKTAGWLPTTLGPTVPKNAFIRNETISSVLGATVPYVTAELPDWAGKLFEVRQTASPKDLVAALESQAETKATNPQLAAKVYGLVAHQGAGENLQQLFKDKPLIHLPGHSRRWLRSIEVVWLDRSDTFGEEFGYLENVYPKLREFFVEGLGVKPDVDSEIFANRWLALAATGRSQPGDVEPPMTQIFQALLPECRRIRSGGTAPSWWGDFSKKVRFWCRDKGFKYPAEAYVGDDGEIRRLFAKGDVAFVWRPEKLSFADVEDIYRTLGARFLSEAVNVECLDGSGETVSRPQYLTGPAKA